MTGNHLGVENKMAHEEGMGPAKEARAGRPARQEGPPVSRRTS